MSGGYIMIHRLFGSHWLYCKLVPQNHKESTTGKSRNYQSVPLGVLEKWIKMVRLQTRSFNTKMVSFSCGMMWGRYTHFRKPPSIQTDLEGPRLNMSIPMCPWWKHHTVVSPINWAAPEMLLFESIIILK